jgi:tRNA G37 N-methylase Trm5
MSIIIDKFNLMAYFTKYNNEFFGGILPYPEFKIRKSYFTLGYFSCNYNNDYSMYNCVLEISNRYDYTEEQLRNVIVHEMIHYYLAFTKKDIKMEHGAEFDRMATKLNREYFLNITSTIDVSNYKKKQSFSLGYIGVSLLS